MRTLIKIASSVFVLSLMSVVPFASASSISEGDLIKCPDHSAVYYVGPNNGRYAFPNEKVYFSWYEDFNTVQDVTCEELASYRLGGSVTYQGGTRLVKIPSVPTVYATTSFGRLRAIDSEEQANVLYGPDWAKRVDDLSEAFFPHYVLGNPLDNRELPEGLILSDSDGAIYRVDEAGRPVFVDDILGTVRKVTMSRFALDDDHLDNAIEEADRSFDMMGSAIRRMRTVSEGYTDLRYSGMIEFASETRAFGNMAVEGIEPALNEPLALGLMTALLSISFDTELTLEDVESLLETTLAYGNLLNDIAAFAESNGSTLGNSGIYDEVEAQLNKVVGTYGATTYSEGDNSRELWDALNLTASNAVTTLTGALSELHVLAGT